MQKLVEKFIQTANAFDIDGALSLFAPDAVVEDVSVGHAFVGRENIRDYFERFFVGYNTASRLLSLQQPDDHTAIIRLDFTGNFGHEIGILNITINADGLIERIDADLEYGLLSPQFTQHSGADAGKFLPQPFRRQGIQCHDTVITTCTGHRQAGGR